MVEVSPLPGPEALEGPEGARRLHETLNSMRNVLLSIESGETDTTPTDDPDLVSLQAEVNALKATISALETTVAAIPVARVYETTLTAGSVTSATTITHNLGTKKIYTAFYVDGTPSFIPYAVEGTDDTVNINFAGTPTTPLTVNVLTFEKE